MVLLFNRYYYSRGILIKVDGQRLVYQFANVPKSVVDISASPPANANHVTANGIVVSSIDELPSSVALVCHNRHGEVRDASPLPSNQR